LSAKRRKARDAAATRRRILNAATAEFARYGFAGARVDRISRRARTFDRMLYYYYGDKMSLFRVVLENTYEELWRAEEALKLPGVAPEAGIRELVAFTWRYFVAHPEFIRLLNSENLQRGQNVRRSARVGKLSSPFIATLEDLLRRGQARGTFRRGIHPVRLYITIAALAYFYVANRYTLTNFLNFDLMAKPNQEAWLDHITEVVLAGMRPRGR
jgi:AcrR family transcriptional regulator